MKDWNSMLMASSIDTNRMCGRLLSVLRPMCHCSALNLGITFFSLCLISLINATNGRIRTVVPSGSRIGAISNARDLPPPVGKIMNRSVSLFKNSCTAFAWYNDLNAAVGSFNRVRKATRVAAFISTSGFTIGLIDGRSFRAVSSEISGWLGGSTVMSAEFDIRGREVTGCWEEDSPVFEGLSTSSIPRLGNGPRLDALGIMIECHLNPPILNQALSFF